MRIFALVSILGFLFTNPAMGENSKDYVLMSQATWRAFECSYMASKIDNPKEQERLFLFGYDQGQKFIAALESKKVKKEYFSAKAPGGIVDNLWGPTPDFVLGRIFQATQESAFDAIWPDSQMYTKEPGKIRAENKFREMSCELIGK